MIKATSAILLCLFSSSCSRTVSISATALDNFAVVTRLEVPSSAELGGDEIALLAGRANVSEDVIRDVAPVLHDQPAWKSSTTRLREFIGQVPEDVRSGTISLACDVIQGEIQSREQMVQALIDEFGTVSESEAEQIVTSFAGYYNDMTAALNEGDESAASVVLACYIADIASG